MKSPKYKLDFIAKSGVANGRRVVFPYNSYEFHLEKYGNTTRKYLKNDKFYSVDVIDAIENNSSFVYPQLKYNKNGEIVETGSYNFYFPISNPNFINKKTGKRATEFLKVTVKKDNHNIIIIITLYKTSNINQKKFINKKICKQIKKL